MYRNSKKKFTLLKLFINCSIYQKYYCYNHEKSKVYNTYLHFSHSILNEAFMNNSLYTNGKIKLSRGSYLVYTLC